MASKLSAISRTRGYVCAQCTIRLSAGSKRHITQNFLRRKLEEDLEHKEEAVKIRRGEKKSMLTILEERGLVKQITGDRNALDNLMIDKAVPVYVGVDPTAPALHIGHMLPIMITIWMYLHRYPAFALLGGTTARIGDPTDRLQPRDEVSRAVRNTNMVQMHVGLKKLWAQVEKYAHNLHGYEEKDRARLRSLYNNATWHRNLTIVDFIRELGAGTRLATLLSRDSVKLRQQSGDGLSVAELMYPMLQAWDWFELYKQRGVQIQVGGSDQYGNLVTGVEAVKHMAEHWGGEAHNRETHPQLFGITTPLLTTASGEKIGKSAGNAVWLDPTMMTSFDLYQHFVRLPDSQVEQYLKQFTLTSLEKIAEIMKGHNKDPGRRLAQRALAYDFVYLVHGQEAANKARSETERLYGSANRSGSDDMLQNLYRSVSAPTESNASPAASKGYLNNPNNNSDSVNPVLNKFAKPADSTTLVTTVRMPYKLIETEGFKSILLASGLVQSKSEGHRLISAKGAYIGGSKGNNTSMEDQLKWRAIESHFSGDAKPYVIDGKRLFIRVGKWKVRVIELLDQAEWEEVTGLDTLNEKQRASLGGLLRAWIVKNEMETEQGRTDVTLEEVIRKQVTDAKVYTTNAGAKPVAAQLNYKVDEDLEEVARKGRDIPKKQPKMHDKKAIAQPERTRSEDDVDEIFDSRNAEGKTIWSSGMETVKTSKQAADLGDRMYEDILREAPRAKEPVRRRAGAGISRS